MNKQRNQLGNIIPLMYIKSIIHDKNKRKNPGNWDINIIIACIKRSDNYRLDEWHFVESRDQSPKDNLAHANFFTFYTAIGVNGRLFPPYL